MDKGLRDFFNMAILTVLIVIRIFMKNSEWMDWLTLLALGISLADLYSEVAKRYYRYERFVQVRGFALAFGVLYVICVCFVVICPINIPDRWVDVLSLTALLVSVPTDLYCEWIGKYIKSFGKHREKRHKKVQTESIGITAQGKADNKHAD